MSLLLRTAGRLSTTATPHLRRSLPVFRNATQRTTKRTFALNLFEPYQKHLQGEKVVWIYLGNVLWWVFMMPFTAYTFLVTEEPEEPLENMGHAIPFKAHVVWPTGTNCTPFDIQCKRNYRMRQYRLNWEKKNGLRE